MLQNVRGLQLEMMKLEWTWTASGMRARYLGVMRVELGMERGLELGTRIRATLLLLALMPHNCLSLLWWDLACAELLPLR